MRPHRLRITAFGSFPGEEEVDFDALSEAGLFLIHGPTGAGKTTVLDALCYALYGQVPGQRNSARSLRCDHAPPARGPSVVLEVTIRGRLFRITRSPAWQRPKQRGTGTTEEKAKVIVEELQASGEWIGLTTRADEAGELVSGLLGMNAAQFCQVAMLPQGEFARFLRADGEERRKVLERLFSVKIYAAAESWLADRRTEAFRDQQALRREVDSVVNRIEEAAGLDLLAALAAVLEAPSPPGDDDSDPGLFPLPGAEPGTDPAPGGTVPVEGSAAGTAEPGGTAPGPGTAGPEGARSRPEGSAGAVSAEDDPLGWADALVTLAGEAAAAVAGEEIEAAVLEARRRLEDGVALADRRRRHAEALTRSRALEERAEERADLEAILAEAARADRVLPLIQEAGQRAETAAKTRNLAADARSRALPLLRGAAPAAGGEDRVAGPGRPAGPGRGPDGALGSAEERSVGPDLLAALERDRRDEITRLGELRAEETRLGEILRERVLEEQEITRRTVEQAGVETRLEILPALRDGLDARLTSARLDAARLPAAEAARETAAARLRAVENRDRLAADLDAARRELTERLSVLEQGRAPQNPATDAAGPEGRGPDAPGEGTGDREAAGSRDSGALRDAAELREGIEGWDPDVPGDVAELREALGSRERERRDALAGLEGLRADEARLAELDAELAVLDADLHGLTEQEAALAGAQRELPAALAEASARLAAVRAEAAGIPAAQAAADAAAVVLESARRRDALRADLEAARAARSGAVDRAQDLRDRLQHIRQARIDGMAAELAAGLVPGEACAVCGSPDHPAPASPAEAAPTADDERAAQSDYDAATDRRQAAESAVAALASQLDEAVAVAGDLAAPEAGEALDAARGELAALLSAAEAEPGLAADLDRAAAELEAVKGRAGEIDRRLAEGQARRIGARAEQARLESRLDEARGADPTVRARRDRLAAEAAALALALAAAARVEEISALHREAATRHGIDRDTIGRGPADEPVGGDESLGGDEPAAGDAQGEPRALSAVRAAEDLREAERILDGLREAAGAVPALETELGGLVAELKDLQERSRGLAVDLSARRANVERLTAEADRTAARLDAARGEDPTLAARLERLADEAELLREAAEAARQERAAAAELEAALARAGAAAAEAGFLGVEDARAAVRPAAEQADKAERLRALDRERAAVDAQLADPELIAAAAEPEPDLAALEAARDAADTAHAAFLSTRNRAEGRRDRLAALRAELAGCLGRWRPAAERHRLADRLAALTSGNSSDNRWSMRLSSYVLGERLRQVVDSANERLDHMSGGRYLLEHDLRRAAGDRSRSGGGLGLRVLDGWTGVDRDPATLSGGEGFITSLALALGLADVVTAEAGGVELGTLFVDEGFGTLDEDTLDGVLDILDGLRDGGRAVGIVSHVGELRTRIPAQLQIRKERHGSSIRQ
ncbi:AAA family ATPase [Planobispora longispora]|uniref:Nuclease SbcCD subunit C n=1 Tax=Planobispora longispora TaxID=28887 RepID=A0A8J3RSR9_9ACTN|nr:AAA family ATPase [Planobispora longispora]GIH79521.1 hypothetical protein Plo01_59500 [Planobispora longispora]